MNDRDVNEMNANRKEGYTFIKLNNKCNNLCNFCADDWNIRKLPDPSFEQIKKELHNGRKQGFHRLIISGGEPTISPILFDVIDYARRIGFDYIHLVTNGRMLAVDSFFNRIIKVVDRFQISMFEFYPDVFDDMAGVKSYKQVIKAMKKLAKVPNEVIVNAVITKQNYKHLNELFLLLYALDVVNIQFAFINPTGFVKQFFDKVFVTYTEVEPYTYKVIETAKYLGYRNVWFENFPACIFKDYKKVIDYLSDFKHPIENKDYYTVNKIKPDFCKKCKFYKQCEGIFKNYYKIKGFEELKPIEE